MQLAGARRARFCAVGLRGLWVRLAVVSNTAALSQLLPVVPSYVGWMQGQLLRIIYLFGGLEATSKPQKKLEIK